MVLHTHPNRSCITHRFARAVIRKNSVRGKLPAFLSGRPLERQGGVGTGASSRAGYNRSALPGNAPGLSQSPFLLPLSWHRTLRSTMRFQEAELAHVTARTMSSCSIPHHAHIEGPLRNRRRRRADQNSAASVQRL